MSPSAVIAIADVRTAVAKGKFGVLSSFTFWIFKQLVKSAVHLSNFLHSSRADIVLG